MALIAIVSKGAFSYDSLKSMSLREIKQIQNTLNKYFKEKAAAMNKANRGSGENLVQR